MREEKKIEFINEQKTKVKNLCKEFSTYEKMASSDAEKTNYSFLHQMSYIKDLIDLLNKDIQQADKAENFGESMIKIKDSLQRIELSFDEAKSMV